MKILDIAKKVGLGLLREAVPGGGLILQAVNEFLPDDKKLPADATGEQVRNAAESLPPQQRAQLLEKDFDVEITQIKESNETLRVMLQADAASTHTTRPKMALGSFHLVAIVTIAIAAGWLYAVFQSENPLKQIVDGWPFILALTGPFVTIMHGYFGILKQEHRQRLNGGAEQSTPSGLGGILSAVIGRR